MKFDIIIASKGRPNCPTANLLAQGLRPDFSILVEPQEQAAYEAQWPGRTIALKEGHRGLAYARQSALELNGSQWYWMLDDDITGFYEARGGKCLTIKAAVCLALAEGLILKEEQRVTTLGMAGLEYQQFAWRSKANVIRGGYCDVAVAINREAKVDYDLNFKMKVDRDFTLSMMASGYSVIRTGRLAFSAPENGTNDGGLKQEYQKELAEMAMVEAMIAKWGTEICQHIVKPNGRHDVRIDWSKLA